MTKYREFFQKMLEDNKELFENFRQLHDKYSADPQAHQETYNTEGKPVMEVIRDYEDRLCNRSEGSGYAQYSGNLAEKFWEEIRREFPMIDRIGIIIRKEPAIETAEVFEIKKINLG